MRTDVAVIGLGAMGSAALWRLASRGARVAGFEQFEPAHERGSSHGESRIIRSAYYEAPHYVPLVQDAFRLWRLLEGESGAALLTMTGALMIGPRDSALVAGAITSARDHGLPYELLDAGAVHQRYPHHRLRAGEIAVYDGQAGALRPEVAVRSMVAQAERHGATVHRSTAVTSIETGAETVRITAGGQVHHARHAIVAAGAWLPHLLPDLPVPLQVERQVVASFVVDEPARFSPQRCPVFMHEVAPGRFRYGFPALDGHTIKLGVHHEGAITTPGAVDRVVHAEDLAPLQRFVRDNMAGVTQAVARSQICLYTNTPDEHFVVGALQRYPSLTIVSACSGHGFKFAPVIGDAAADLALDGGTEYPIDLFTPTRFLNQDPRWAEPCR